MNRILFAAVALFTVGCGGGGYCGYVEDLNADCGVTGTTTTGGQTCEEVIEGCSAADEDILIDVTDCIIEASGGDVCPTTTGTTGSTSTPVTGFAELMACLEPIEDLSESCAAFETTM